jgi:hypothetical protein
LSQPDPLQTGKILGEIIFSKSISFNQAKDAFAFLEHMEDIENMQNVIDIFVPQVLF